MARPFAGALVRPKLWRDNLPRSFRAVRGVLRRLWRPVDPPCIRRRLEAVEALGSGVLAGYVLPWMSWPQLVVFGVGFLIGLPAYLGIPVWFVLLGRHFGMASP